MTDNEIVKALECCSTSSCKACSECPYHGYYGRCITKRNADIVDLINSQKEENSNLTSHLTSLQNDLTSAKAEVERLRKENEILSVNADTAFQDGLNETRDLYRAEVRNEVATEAMRVLVEKFCKGKKGEGE